MYIQVTAFLMVLFLYHTSASEANCARNEVFKTCGSSCPKICNEIIPRICPADCLQGCFCQDGYIREKIRGLCVPETQCQPKCEENEEYSMCGSACPGTCSQPIRICNKKCVKGCFCKAGYLRGGEGKCVKRERC